MTCLILAPETDVHALAVQREVQQLGGQCIVVDVASLPLERPISFSVGASPSTLEVGEYLFASNQLRGIWNRRPSMPQVGGAVPQADDAEFAVRSTNASLFGALLSLCKNWVNPLPARATANYKPYQLSIASSVGLSIPRTLITSSSEAALVFVDSIGETIYKTVATWRYGLKETRLIRDVDLNEMSSLRSCPTVFQEHIPGQYDVRVTIVGSQVFAASVHYLEGRSPIDGRIDRVPIKSITLPTHVEDQLRRMQSALGLVYGAYDLRRTEEDEFVFFEVNPDGQYLYIEMATDLPISRAIAKVLLNEA